MRRSSLKTIPAYARDPLSLGRPALRKNVRTTLLLGTALGASLMAAMIIDSQPANAAVLCVSTTGATTFAPPTAEWTTDQPTGIHCTVTEDLSISTVGQVDIGGNGNGNGIELTASRDITTVGGLDLSVVTDPTGTIGATGNAVTGDGILVSLTDTGGVNPSDTITIVNGSDIGTSTTHVGGSGIAVSASISGFAGDATLGVSISNSGAIFDTSNPTDPANLDGIGGTAHAYYGSLLPSSNLTAAALGLDPFVHVTIVNTGPIVTGGTAIGFGVGAGSGYDGFATATLTVSNSGTLTKVGVGPGDGIFEFAYARTGGILGQATAVTSVSNSGAIGAAAPAPQFYNGIASFSFANASGNFGLGYDGGTAIATTTIVNGPSGAYTGAIHSSGTGIVGSATALARGYKYAGGTAISGVVISNAGAITSTGNRGITGAAYSSATDFFGGFLTLSGIGGYAAATTNITNGGAINSIGDAINGSATAVSRAIFPTWATGGTATAGVIISNTGALASTLGGGIVGASTANANGGSTSFGTSYRGYGGYATATTTIANAGPGTITSFNNGIAGYSTASAIGTGSTFNAFNPITGLHYFGAGWGGYATATTNITNAVGITSTGTVTGNRGIWGTSTAIANGIGYRGYGGYALSTTTISNGGAITSKYTGIAALANATANGFGSNFNNFAYGGAATGGQAIAGVVITNTNNITTGTTGALPKEGIYGGAIAHADGDAALNLAYAATGGTATASTNISNTGVIKSNWNGITTRAFAYANGFGNSTLAGGTGTGGHAEAHVVINNTGGSITSATGMGIYGSAKAIASGYGFNAFGGLTTAIATDNENNNAPIVSVNDGIVGLSNAQDNGIGSTTFPGSGTGGIASASTVVTNGAGGVITVSGVGQEGIDAQSYAGARGVGYTAQGGYATASTSITNAGAIKSRGDGLYGRSQATANAAGVDVASAAQTSTATGGTATATMLITNSGVITSTGDEGIDGRSNATANAGSGGTRTFRAFGGTANATTNIFNSNSGTILSQTDGIEGRATATAVGFGSNTAPTATVVGGTGTGGIANAGLVITNLAKITNKTGESIDGQSFADADAFGFTALGNHASASTLVSNTGFLTSYTGNGIDSFATAFAFGIAPVGTLNSKGTGGVAIANATVYNTGAGATIHAGFPGTAINSISTAFATGIGFTGTGGSATATTNVTNSGQLSAYGNGGANAGDGIDGTAISDASGAGNFTAATLLAPTTGKALGGHAYSTVTINNSVLPAATVPGIYAHYGNGIVGFSFANATGAAYAATGGHATAFTTITNSAVIEADDGIDGIAFAFAGAIGSAAADPGSATGGTASAGVVITNTNNITAIFGNGTNIGIYGNTLAIGGAIARRAYAGFATATTSITASGGTIISTGDGIRGNAVALADALSFYGINNTATGGHAIANVTINNSDNIYSTRNDGIVGVTTASANGFGNNGTAGTATAHTIVSNSGTVKVYNNNVEGLDARSTANANGGRKGGTAGATTDETNAGLLSIHTYGNGSPGMFANSNASANAVFAAGNATAITTATNNGKITTQGTYSYGIAAYSTAQANGLTGGTAIANTTAINSAGAAVYTAGYRSDGVFGVSTATAGGIGTTTGNANATTTITNAGAIGTYGAGAYGVFAGSTARGGTAVASTSVLNTSSILTNGATTITGYSADGIRATSLAAGFFSNYALAQQANATTSVSNAGTIVTTGNGAEGIDATSYAYGRGATATTRVYNSTKITTNGYNAQGIFAGAFTRGDSSAYALVSNSGTITTNGGGSAGVFAISTAKDVLAANTTANTVVINSHTIVTQGGNSPGVYAVAGARSLGGAGANATVTVTNTGAGSIKTYGTYSPAVSAAILFGDSRITINNGVGAVLAAYGAPYTAITASGATTTIGNSGLIYGNVELSAFNDVLTNTSTATWTMKGNSVFGAGNDTVNNAGTVNMQNRALDLYYAGQTVNTGVAPISGFLFHTIFIDGLETWNNFSTNGVVQTGGLIDMRNGVPNQQIVLSGAFNGTTPAITTGPGSRLGVDAFLGAPGSTADLLTIAKNVGGVTHIIVNDTNPGLGAYNPIGIPVVIVGGTAVATNFDLPQGPIVKGLFDYDLYMRPTALSGPVFFLASTPNQAANELPRVMTAVQDIWHEAAGVWADRTADLRSTFSAPVTCDPRMVTKAPCLASAPGGVGPGAWARAFGEWSHNDGTAIVDPPAGALGKAHSYDVSYHQNIFGVQAGMDFAAQRMGYENFVFGVLVGAVNSKVDFVSGTNVKLDGGNLGAYATYLNHNFFTDALFMANILNVHYNQSALLNSAGTAVSFGGHIDMGYRFNFQQNWFAEPLGTIEAVYTDFSNVNLPGVGVNLNNEHARGRLGLRVGTSFVNGGYRIEPSLTGSIWHSFTDDNIAELTSGAYAIDLTDVNTHRTYGEIGGAVNIFEMGSRWSAFAKGDFRFATDYTAGSGKIGFRYNW